MEPETLRKTAAYTLDQTIPGIPFDRYATFRLEVRHGFNTTTPGLWLPALVKLSTKNLANLHPHPLHAAFYCSHPPVVERVGRLRSHR